MLGFQDAVTTWIASTHSRSLKNQPAKMGTGSQDSDMHVIAMTQTTLIRSRYRGAVDDIADAWLLNTGMALMVQ